MKEGGFWERVFTTGKKFDYVATPDTPGAWDVDGDGGDKVFVAPVGSTTTHIDPIEVIKHVWIPRAIIAVGVLGIATCMCTAAINSMVSGASGGSSEPTPISSPVPAGLEQHWAHVEIPKPSPTPSSGLQMQIVP